MVDTLKKDTTKKAAFSGQITPTQESKEKTAKGSIPKGTRNLDDILGKQPGVKQITEEVA